MRFLAPHKLPVCDSFLVIVPTIRQSRPLFEDRLERVRASFTLPTDFHILDGSNGKVAALNRAFDEILAPSKATTYVTLDDDIGLEPGWQEAIAGVFATLPKIGICSIWPGDTQEHRDLVGERQLGPWQTKKGLEFRMVPRHAHIPGGLLAFRREVALAIGKQPETGLGYEIYEDAWRGRMGAKMGWSSAYVRGPGGWEMLSYQDDPSYVAAKASDLAKSRAMTAEIMRASGLGDPWHIRLRRVVAKIRGRNKD